MISNCVNFVIQSSDTMTPATLDDFRTSENYKAFIDNALPEINRAIQQIALQEKIPVQAQEYSCNAENKSNFLHLKLSDIEDKNFSVRRIFKVEFLYEGYSFTLPYRRVKNEIIVTNPKLDGIILLRYFPKPRLLTLEDIQNYNFGGEDESTDLNDLGIDDTMCSDVIPYLVKGVLWQETEPELAQVEYNKGLNNLEYLPRGDEYEPDQERVQIIEGW